LKGGWEGKSRTIDSLVITENQFASPTTERQKKDHTHFKEVKKGGETGGSSNSYEKKSEFGHPREKNRITSFV